MIDVIQRYWPIVQIMKRLCTRKDCRILEIGSSSYGTARFYEGNIIGLDIQFHDETNIAKNLFPIVGSACFLPFRDSAFEVVVSVSMLEHIQSNARSIVIREMLRVTKNFIVISVPCGKKSEYCEEKLRRFQSLFFEDLGWLREHEEFGLPEKGNIIEEIYNSNPNSKIEVFGNVNLTIWLTTMIVQLPFDTLLWKFAPAKRNELLKVLMKMIGWFMPIFDFGSTYQKIYIIKRV